MTKSRNETKGARIVAQQVKPPLSTPTSHFGVLVQVLAAVFPIQLPINAIGKAAEDGSSTWAHATHL